jgi:hypothetical protein
VTLVRGVSNPGVRSGVVYRKRNYYVSTKYRRRWYRRLRSKSILILGIVLITAGILSATFLVQQTAPVKLLGNPALSTYIKYREFPIALTMEEAITGEIVQAWVWADGKVSYESRYIGTYDFKKDEFVVKPQPWSYVLMTLGVVVVILASKRLSSKQRLTAINNKS